MKGKTLHKADILGLRSKSSLAFLMPLFPAHVPSHDNVQKY